VDECLTRCTGSYADCTNTEGSYTCSCEPGYIVNDEDICLGNFFKKNLSSKNILFFNSSKSFSTAFQPVSNLAVECAFTSSEIGVSERALMFNIVFHFADVTLLL